MKRQNNSEERRKVRMEQAKRKAEQDRINNEIENGKSAMDVWER